MNWETPQYLFDQLDREFQFTLDCASDDRNAKCEKHFTAEQDGLNQDWGGIRFGAIPHMVGKSENGLKKQQQR